MPTPDKRRKTRWRLPMMPRWMATAATLFVSAIALIVAVIIGRGEITSWSGYDWIRSGADERKVRILVALLSADPSGKHTADLESALKAANKRFRRLGRPWSPSEDERLDDQLERKSISNLLSRHQSDAFIYGHVGTAATTILLVPKDLDREVRGYSIKSQSDFRSLIDDLEPILVQGIQNRIERNKFTVGRSDLHKLIDLQIEDLLEQTRSEEARRNLLFQSAFTKDKLAFWRRDIDLANESAEMYETLLSETTDNFEEGILRINLGVHYQIRGFQSKDPSDFQTSIEHFAKAEQIFRRRPDVPRWAKVRNQQTTNEIWLYSLTDDTKHLVSASKRQMETFQDSQGWLSDAGLLLVFQEGVGADLLFAYARKDTEALRRYFSLMLAIADQLQLFADQQGVGDSPWVRALINCTALELIDFADLEQALREDPKQDGAALRTKRTVWTNSEISARRSLVESWQPEAREAPFEHTFPLQLNRLADLTREEALRSHDFKKLERSFELTRQYRVLVGVESGTISYGQLDLSQSTAETVLGFEGTLALACADRQGIEHVLKLLKRTAATCVAEPEACGHDVSWIGYWEYWLQFGLHRWGPLKTRELPAPPQRTPPGSNEWKLARYHALWLRHDLSQLPPPGESLCPSRVPWVE